MIYKKSIVLNRILLLLSVVWGLVLLHSCSSRTSISLKDADSPYIVFITAEGEYNSAETLPAFANELENKYNFDCEVLYGGAKKHEGIVGMGSLKKADLLVLYVRRQALPVQQMKFLREYLDSGRPLIGLRTASHAFDTRGRAPMGCEEWRSFDHDVLGGNYHNHYKKGPKTIITTAAGAQSHPILNGIETPFTSDSSLYMTSPLADLTTPLLIGSIPNQVPEPIAWTNRYKDARIFYTSLGSPEDFNNGVFRKLLVNAVFWALDRPKSSLE